MEAADARSSWDREEGEWEGHCRAVGPPTVLQKPGGVDGRWAGRRGRTEGGGVLMVQCGGLMDREAFGRFCGGSNSSELGFPVDSQLIEMVKENCLLNAEKTKIEDQVSMIVLPLSFTLNAVVLCQLHKNGAECHRIHTSVTQNI